MEMPTATPEIAVERIVSWPASSTAAPPGERTSRSSGKSPEVRAVSSIITMLVRGSKRTVQVWCAPKPRSGLEADSSTVSGTAACETIEIGTLASSDVTVIVWPKGSEMRRAIRPSAPEIDCR